MFTPRKKQYGGGGGAKASPKGLFVDGIWNCDCEPRLPASHFLVRKEGPNKGRWFYTCQESKGSGCGFFLWDDDASGREMRAVLNNSRSEPGVLSTPADAGSGVVSKTAVAGHVEAGSKWTADLGRKKEDEFGDWDLSPDDEMQLVRTVEKTAAEFPETPRKAVKFDTTTTPGMKRKRDEADAFPTPQTGSSGTGHGFRTGSTGAGTWGINDHNSVLSPSATPTPARHRDATGSSQLDSDYEITQEVLDILKDEALDTETVQRLRSVLNQHALRSQGIAKGRDITRIALKSKEAKIAELQERIAALETERAMDKVVIGHFKSDMVESVSRRGRGRGRRRS